MEIRKVPVIFSLEYEAPTLMCFGVRTGEDCSPARALAFMLGQIAGGSGISFRFVRKNCLLLFLFFFIVDLQDGF